ncbi:conserved hypothetical protein [Vibrio phage 381E49-1]|nr:conserved hypothetical protein [Vibrio phage 381E49-1]
MMTDERTKGIRNKQFKYPNTPTFKEHQEAMALSSRMLWKQYIEEIKNKTK